MLAAADNIHVKLIDNSLEPSCQPWPIKGLNYVEELLFEVLAERGVRPIYRHIFAFRMANEPTIWLAPNVTLEEVQSAYPKETPILELRVRFRPSSIAKLKTNDRYAFELLFAQLRHDFLHTKLSKQRPDFILLDESVLCLITTDLIRHAFEHDIEVDQVFKRINTKDFLPKCASKFQKSLLFMLKEKLNLQRSIRIGYEKCKSVVGCQNGSDITLRRPSSDSQTDEINGEPNQVSSPTNNRPPPKGKSDDLADAPVLMAKQVFIETFLSELYPDYGSEVYRVQSQDIAAERCHRKLELRLRYSQPTQDCSNFLVESRPVGSSACSSAGRRQSLRSHSTSGDATGSSSTSADRNGSLNWQLICDINSIGYGTLRESVVEISRSNGRPFRVSFKSQLLAKSFLSLIDGYYRLMRKWQFNFCRDVQSPDLGHLRRIKSHGPIGYETMRLKMPRTKKAGTYLVRRCMERNNGYIVDVLVSPKVRLTVDINYNPAEKVYYKTLHALSKPEVRCEILLNNGPHYKSLRTLLEDLQIKIRTGAPTDDSFPPLQLKYLIPPSEYDDCPVLLLSIARQKLREFDLNEETKISSSINELPRFIPASMLQMSGKLLKSVATNHLSVRVATLSGGESVIVKEQAEERLFGFRSTGSSSAGLSETGAGSGCHSSNGSSSPGELPMACVIVNSTSGAGSSAGAGKLAFFAQLRPAQLRLADWIFLKSPLFAETHGLDLSRTALVQEYLPLGRLDRFLVRSGASFTEPNRRSIGCQLASALLFLQEKRIIHGKLRCHNVFLKSLAPLQVKLTDPMGTFDCNRDKAFLAPEYFGLSNPGGHSTSAGPIQVVALREYDPGIDVWAFGTLLWQIYSQGGRPPAGLHANCLTQPKLCPNDMWRLLESCWMDPSSRASPQSIYRDLNDYFVWDIRELHNYDYIQEREPSELSDSDRLDSHREAQEELGSLSSKWMASNSGETKLTDLTEDNSATATLCLSEWDRQSVWQVHSSNLKLGPEIGRGSCGRVLKGMLSQWDGLSEQVVAVKCINNSILSSSYTSNNNNGHLPVNNSSGGGGGGSATSAASPGRYLGDLANRLGDLRREFEILKSLNHKNIVKTLGFVDESSENGPNEGGRCRMMLLVEYMPLGSLLSCLKNSHHQHLSSLPLHKYACDIAQGMAYLERMKVVHRDLALRNILLKSKSEVKICDFGLAQFLDSDNQFYKFKTERALPLRWYAPEVLETWHFTHKSDVWSFGIVLWEIYSGGNNPQYSSSYANLADTLRRGERLLMPKDCPPRMYQFILAHCWAYNPEERQNFAQICQTLHSMPATDYLCPSNEQTNNDHSNQTEADQSNSGANSASSNGLSTGD